LAPGVPTVLVTHRDDDSLINGLPRRETCSHGPVLVWAWCCRSWSSVDSPSSRRRSSSRRRYRCRHGAALGQLRDRYLNGDGVHVRRGQGVDPATAAPFKRSRLKGAGRRGQRSIPSRRRSRRRADRRDLRRADRVDRLVRQRRVVGDRVLPNVARRAREVASQDLRRSVLLFGHRVELLAVQVASFRT